MMEDCIGKLRSKVSAPIEHRMHFFLWAYFLIQKSVGWTFDTLELPPAQTLMRMAA